MTPEEFRAIRDGLGMTLDEVAEHLAMNRRTPIRWEAGASAIPASAAEALELLEAQAADEVARHVEGLRGQVRAGLQPLIAIENGVSAPDFHSPRWQRAIAFRVRQLVPNVRIVGVGVDPNDLAHRVSDQ